MVSGLTLLTTAALIGAGTYMWTRRSQQNSQSSSGKPQPTMKGKPLDTVNYTTLPSAPSWSPDKKITLYSPEYIDVERFNALLGDAAELKWVGKPLTDITKLFVKEVILDDETTIYPETLKVPGFVGIADDETVTDAEGKSVSAHADVAQLLERDGLLVVTFQWDKERYGIPLDTRQPMEKELFQEAFAKNEAHHAGALVPATRLGDNDEPIPSFAAHNEPGNYHEGMYGDDGFVTAAQRLVFPDFVSREQARGYTDSIMCWMGLLNPFVKFPNDYNGGDPTRVTDASTLRTFLKNGLLACLGDRTAVKFLNDTVNMTYCAEYIYVTLNTVLFPFNKPTLTDLLDGDAAKADQILAIQTAHNNRQPTILTQKSEDAEFEALLTRTPSNPQFDAFNIAMPVVPADLPPLNKVLEANNYYPPAGSLPLPPFLISQILRRAFRTILPRQQAKSPSERQKIAQAQARLLRYLEAALVQQLGLENAASTDPRIQAMKQFTDLVIQQVSRDFETYAEFDAVMDQLMAQADKMLIGAGDRTRFVPPRIYTDWGQQDGDTNLPKGWGFKLETVCAFTSRRVIGHPDRRVPKKWRTIQVQDPLMQGDDVKLLQGAMVRAGMSVEADGFFGPKSESAVKEYQTQKGLEPTGKIDEATRKSLLSA
ncbi:MAG: peptidoglycan-binding domain-containing protein [Leptolyngbyaceae bacterium]|nr:peptidoglycan-binding domain-containing protein [Leptolyngbyaceae bacterium]